MINCKLVLCIGISISIFAALAFNFVTSLNVEAVSTSPSNEDQNSTCSPIYLAKSLNTTSRNFSETNNLPGFHAIKKFDRNGTLVAAWGTKG